MSHKTGIGHILLQYHDEGNKVNLFWFFFQSDDDSPSNGKSSSESKRGRIKADSVDDASDRANGKAPVRVRKTDSKTGRK